MAAKSDERRAIVIGGSIAGLFVGAFLRRIGWRVDIYERSSIELIGRGVGIFATHLELFEALDKCGAGMVDIVRRSQIPAVIGVVPALGEGDATTRFHCRAWRYSVHANVCRAGTEGAGPSWVSLRLRGGLTYRHSTDCLHQWGITRERFN